MDPLNLLYWIKACLGALAGVLCILLWVNSLYMGIGTSVLTFALSDRILRRLFINKVDKPSTVTKTGWGVYIITWLFVWTLLFTLFYPPV